ncbi:tripartite tricarboxylate transporter TctB family protein [Microbacterium sp. NPDC076768]|uniref:tripartite tricarboxylate transporter TctB family protein n=1 Tax=Microbacterium sp. NPDC076768 TaxID=3154858 RepID=UPI00343E2F4E
MMSSNNPTAASAVVGEKLALVPGSGSAATLVKQLTMPVLLIGFGSYLLVGIFTMKVPPGSAFPGPQFFPALITAGLFFFAAVLGVGAFRNQSTGARVTSSREDAANNDGALTQRTVRVDGKSMAWVVGSFAGFALLLNFLGWIIAAALLFWCIARGFGSRRAILGLVVGLTMSSLTYIAFDMALGLSLPSGVLGGGF